MQKIILALAICGCALSASAQDTMAVPAQQEVLQKPSTGDYFGGLTRPLTFDRMIPPTPWR